MILADNLSKRYRSGYAVDGLSFEISEGEVVGFLGPNGAGKSTTMKLVTGYLAPTSGNAYIGGVNVQENPLEARAKLGYMPENVPLYEELRVGEYLRYRGRIKGVPSAEMEGRLGDVLERCSLRPFVDRPIHALSKGYRQRVGLADALIHDPPLLILDEPTNGLDPNQIRQVRQLIRELGKERTVLLSTHILSEVEMTCERVMILDRGSVKASGTPTELAKGLGGKVVLAQLRSREAAVMMKQIDAMEGVGRVSEVASDEDGWKSLEIQYSGAEDISALVFREAVKREWELRGLQERESRLEEVFTSLTHQGDDEDPEGDHESAD
ncbi:MAG: ATP-binding cassette domain-containing protein [Verrucomicrobiota bacterium]